MRIAIDLLWVRSGKVGGTESFIRNLIDGFLSLEENFSIALIVSIDNEGSFKKYAEDDRISLLRCKIKSKNVWKRILWQNLVLGKVLKENNIQFCYEPVYSKPIFNFHHIKYVTTIHDLQALHYPEYHNIVKVLWLKLSWWNTVRTSQKIIAISNFVREDILCNYNISENKVVQLYNPIVIDKEDISDFSFLEKKYKIAPKKYFYTVSSLLPHKNLITIFKVIKYIVDNNIDLPTKLVISGVQGGRLVEIIKIAENYKVVDNIIPTGFISDAERNALYKHAEFFLFPSLFEGFGMPVVEANYFNCKVIATMSTSIPEVTENKLIYVANPFNEKEWVNKILLSKNCKVNKINYNRYDKKIIAKAYMETFKSVILNLI